MNSEELAYFIEKTDGISKPWLLVQLRLKKLQEQKAELPDAEYLQRLQDIHQDAQNLGEWWVGREAEVFGES